LAVDASGFGAGADIGKNMARQDEYDASGEEDHGHLWFLDIRQFTDTTECLQEEVMVYVNKSDIVHGGTHAYYGMANKKRWRCLLYCWKLCDGKLMVSTHRCSERGRIKANLSLCPFESWRSNEIAASDAY
jgi:hypothetical protein